MSATSSPASAWASTAYADAFPSRPRPFNAHQREPRIRTALSCGHHVHIVSNQTKKGISCPFRAVVDAFPDLLKLAGQTIAPSLFRPHSHRLAIPPSRRPVRFSSSRRIGQPFRATGLQSDPAHTLADEPVFQAIAHPHIHLSNVLSSSLSSRWLDPNEIGLTHGTKSLSPDDKAYD